MKLSGIRDSYLVEGKTTSQRRAVTYVIHGPNSEDAEKKNKREKEFRINSRHARSYDDATTRAPNLRLIASLSNITLQRYRACGVCGRCSRDFTRGPRRAENPRGDPPTAGEYREARRRSLFESVSPSPTAVGTGPAYCICACEPSLFTAALDGTRPCARSKPGLLSRTFGMTKDWSGDHRRSVSIRYRSLFTDFPGIYLFAPLVALT
ncbi:hypothetical protein PUN28_001910 [Cardiocondyla obscurior]|uniref:Uncharacterized protein n=1 Tax=Cardiocondyla obscurior TaxID=286306 RepID=A0AAW2GRY7_9HYME